MVPKIMLVQVAVKLEQPSAMEPLAKAPGAAVEGPIVLSLFALGAACGNVRAPWHSLTRLVHFCLFLSRHKNPLLYVIILP